MPPHPASADRRAFTLTEMLIAIALIVVLLSLLLPALGGVLTQAKMTESMNNMRQIAAWMGQYSSDNRDFIVPSRFNYSDSSVYAYPGKVRSNPNPQVGIPHTGTWSDILHSTFSVGVYPEAEVVFMNDYRHDSPDQALYDLLGDGAIDNPFRSAVRNTEVAEGIGDAEPPVPWGRGASNAKIYPGFFAANDFFKQGWVLGPNGQMYTNGQIRFPDQSMYLVDSYYGEIIEPEPFFYEDTTGTNEVDFRYGGDGIALMLFLDGHVDTQSRWEDMAELLDRRVRICNLDERVSTCP